MNNKIYPLIANSGIQFIEKRINLSDESKAFEVRSRFAEICNEIEPGKKEYEIIFPYLFKKRERYIYRHSINDEAFDKKTGKIIEDDIKEDYVEYIDELKGDVVYSVQARASLEAYENAWLPVPFFRKADGDKVHPGPTTWARMWFGKIPLSDKKDDGATHYLIVAYDTKTKETAEYKEVPEANDAEQGSVFVCPKNQDASFNFAALQWVQEWLENEYHERINLPKKENVDEDAELLEEYQERIKEQSEKIKIKPKKYQFYHISLYLNLLKVFNSIGAFPYVSLHSTNQYENKISNEVDLILDIGNSRTCGLLYETTKINKAFKFTDAVPLQIRDLTYPNRKYSDPFAMQLAFLKSTFGKEIIIPENIDAFKWPSLLRVGNEAVWQTVNNNKTASNFSMSSPKRYLWDDRQAVFPWEFISDKREDVKRIDLNGAIVDGVNDLFTADGTLLEKAIEYANKMGLTEPEMGMTPFYSRKSLMTFAFLEILLQALTFSNSYEFRKKHGDEQIPRKLKRLVITCPTAMNQKERFFLRDLALDAVKALSNIFGDEFISVLDIEITPQPKDIKKLAQSDIDEDEKRMIKDWAYDEATASQLTFIYGEIAHRYMNKTTLYFDVTGKKRENSLYPNQNSVCIASIDVGGGTTDMMICNYQTSKTDDTVIIPEPVFWEGFNLAGDDIVKRIIETLVLPPIAEAAKEAGITDIVEVMSFLFGHDMQVHTAEDKMLRKQFANQIAMPIAYEMISHVVNGNADEILSYRKCFGGNNYPEPNAHLLLFINKNFKKRGAKDFAIQKIEWNLNKENINLIVKRVMEKMLKQLSVIIAQFQCDYVLLSGRPTTMPVIKDIFLKYLPAFSSRIVQLGNYRIGRWYPFADASGRIKDPKTCVSVGATISLMSKLGRLEGFRLETKYLKDKQKSTAEYMGKFERSENKLSKIYFTPKKNSNTIIFNSPMLIGFKQLNHEDWIGTPIYKLDFTSVAHAEKLASRLPLKVEIEREYETDKEVIPRIETILDNDGDEIAPSYLQLRLQSLPDEYGYWKDTGSFDLPIF